ncbi:hypothetical protein GN958_ATG00652, partial [Phytophthora infestans]
FYETQDDKGQRFVDVCYIPPTSNECERLFSRAKLGFNDQRKGMDRYTVEQVRSGIGRNTNN